MFRYLDLSYFILPFLSPTFLPGRLCGRLIQSYLMVQVYSIILSYLILNYLAGVGRGKVRVEESAVEVDSWSCSACTFINHPALNRCECCDLPKLSFGENAPFVFISILQ